MSSCYFPVTTFYCFLTECITAWLWKRCKASEGAAEQALRNHSDTAKMAVSTVGTADRALSSERSFPFRAAQVSVNSGIQAELTAG